jgi:lantibiotic modifying enzyme
MLALTLTFVLRLGAEAAVDTVPLAEAREIARWLVSTGRDVPDGRVWPPDPEKPEEVVAHLYSGTSGVVLFFLEAHRLTSESSYMAEARSGADHLLSRLEEISSSEGPGLYTGLAGVGFVLDRTYQATRDEKYLEGVRRVVEILKASALVKGKGLEWNDVTDIISGSAGIGLFLLHAERERDLPQALELAVGAGKRLLELSVPGEPGLKWKMTPDFARLMPNFSHGTAGVAYFLATLYQATGEKRFLEAALAGGEYLKSIADVTGDACLIFHHEPEGEELFYLGWCHGPAGTARLFYRLFEITNDPDWMKWVRMSAQGVLESGIPEKRTPGFWNNVSQCCGSAGVAEFFLSLHQITKEREYLDFARRLTEDTLARATRDASGLRFVQAENRTEPENLKAQTGYMQGAAGIGLWLLRLHAFERGDRVLVNLPDSPFLLSSP